MQKIEKTISYFHADFWIFGCIFNENEDKFRQNPLAISTYRDSKFDGVLTVAAGQQNDGEINEVDDAAVGMTLCPYSKQILCLKYGF